MTEHTMQVRADLFRDRWSTHGERTGIRRQLDDLTVEQLKRLDIFSDLKDSLLEELIPDIAVAQWEPGATLFEEGSYLDLAFYIVSGDVDLFLQKHGSAAEPIFNTRYVTAGDIAESRARYGAASPATGQAAPASPPSPTSTTGEQFTYLSTMDFDLSHGATQRLTKGDFFGEIGALNGWPQSVTARTSSLTTLVQIRVPALRKLKRAAKGLRARIDRVYRERTLLQHLRTTPPLRGCSDASLEALAGKVELRSLEPGDALAREGEPADTVYLVRSGFLKLSRNLGAGDLVVTYVSKGMTIGEVEALIDGMSTWQLSVTAAGYCEVVCIPVADFLALIRQHPAVEARLWESTVARIKEAGFTRKNPERAELIEFALARGLAQGNSVLVMDLDVCTRCDDCVRGCASTHGGRPRFVREGERFGNFLVARSCFHCEDPVCLIGCPTGAIRRTNVGEVIAIDDALCIGCGSCADNCPYDAIVMHDTGTIWPEHSLPKRLRGEERFVASKCDLCHTSDAGPACVNSCPHACAFRVSSLDEFDALLRGNTPAHALLGHGPTAEPQ
jgi:CRP-like cAMP-binding protein/Fe-S-cluster-containing hydrogenase component 2